MENLSRTVRFKAEEIRLIEEFLKANPFLDFSTVTRLAVMQFIKSPNISIQPVTASSKGSTKRRDKDANI